ncbi:MAG: Rid family hydrolase, partial [Pseudomonadota bacterium]
SLDDVVDLTVFYTNYPEHMALGRAVRDEVFGTATPPNWTSVGVAALSPPFIFEAKAIALLP